jgi:hypothetical protein
LFTGGVKVGSQLLQREWSEQMLCLVGLGEPLLIHKIEQLYYSYEIFCLYNILKREKILWPVIALAVKEFQL